MINPITSTLEPGQQKVAGDALQATVVDLTDLSLLGKQVHWNVVGRLFQPIHEALDVLVDTARDYADKAAERATAIGVSPDGRAATVAADASTTGVGPGWTQDTDAVQTIVTNLAAVIAGLRQRIVDTAEPDPVTQDLLIEITAELEKAHWMWQAQVA